MRLRSWLAILLAPLSLAIARADLMSETDLAYRGQASALALQGRALLKGHQILFVAGRSSERLPDYFDDIAAAARAMGAPATKVVRPASTQSPEISIRQLEREILAQYHANGRRPLILVGHSKGGHEILLLTMRRPEILKYVRAVVLLQGAVLGSPLADAHDRICLAGAIPFPLNPIQAPAALACAVLSLWGGDGLNAMKTRTAETLMTGARGQMTAAQARLVSNRVFYVVGGRDDGFSPFMAVDAALLRRLYPGVQNDGLLPVDKQTLPGVGQELGRMVTDHAQLITGMTIAGYPAISSSSSAYRRAFGLALFRELAQALDELPCIQP